MTRSAPTAAHSASAISSECHGSATPCSKAKNRPENGIAVRIASVPSWTRSAEVNHKIQKRDVLLSVSPPADVEGGQEQILTQGGEVSTIQDWRE